MCEARDGAAPISIGFGNLKSHIYNTTGKHFYPILISQYFCIFSNYVYLKALQKNRVGILDIGKSGRKI